MKTKPKSTKPNAESKFSDADKYFIEMGTELMAMFESLDSMPANENSPVTRIKHNLRYAILEIYKTLDANVAKRAKKK